jgi:hypothetical protein
MKINSKKYPKLIELIKYVYPDYKGKDFYLVFHGDGDFIDIDCDVISKSKIFYKFVRLKNCSILHTLDLEPFKRFGKIYLPEGIACVTNCFYDNKDCGINVLLKSRNMLETDDSIFADKIESKKICKLVNDHFSWMLYVDDKKISFDGADHADYFAKHYESLGYTIEWDRDKYNTKFNIEH